MLKEAIIKKIEELELKRTTVSNDTGIPLCDLSSYLNGKRSLAVYKIERLIQYLGIKLI